MEDLKIPRKLYGKTAIIKVIPAWYVPSYATVPGGSEFILNDALDKNLRNRILQALRDKETFKIPNTRNTREPVVSILSQREEMDENPSLAFSTDTELEEDIESAATPVEETSSGPGFGSQNAKDKPKKSEKIKCSMCGINTHVIEKHLKKCKKNKKAKMDLLAYTTKYPKAKVLSPWAVVRIKGEE